MAGLTGGVFLKKLVLSASVMLFCGTLPLCAQGIATDSPPAPPATSNRTAAAMLATCVATLPREALDLVGTLTVRKQRGIVVSEHPYRLSVNWGANPQRVQCDLMDDQGKPQQRLTIIRRNGTPELELRSGSALTPQPMPALSARVLDTDMSWLDLTLDFLWWQDVKLEGEDEVLSRTCDVLLAKPPTTIPGCSGVRIWLLRDNGFLMRAEQLDPDGHPLRRMSVRDVKQFKDRWFISELDVVAEKSDFRTRLFVNNILTP